MKRWLICCSVILFNSLIFAQQAKVADTTKEVVLDNGMKLLLVQKPGTSMISAGWVAHVGSANEQPGITGIAHLFEHMMFKGSPTIGTKNNAIDEGIRAQLDGIRAKMFEIERVYRDKIRLGDASNISDPSLWTDEYKALKKEFDALILKQRDNMIKDEFDQVYAEAGATGMNAFTNRDMTVYFIRVPKNKLELWFWMESERLLQPVFREFYSERDVVYEERRMRTESTPTGIQDEAFENLFWGSNSYGWPIVGWPSDIAAISREQAESFFDIYYAPNNLTAAIVGDFDENEAIELANEYFGRIKKNPVAPPDVVTTGMPLNGEVFYQAEVDAPTSTSLSYRTVAFGGKDTAALEVLANVLSGKTGRLQKRLVLKDKIATKAYAGSNAEKFGGEFYVHAEALADVSAEKLRAVLLDEIEKIKLKGISDYELEKVKNQVRADNFRKVKDPFYLMIQLLYFDGLREWTHIDSGAEALLSVTKDDVVEVAKKYLVAENRGNKLFSRKKDATPEDPRMAKFNDEQKQTAKQMLAQLKSLPAKKLEEVLQSIRQNQSQAPAPMKAVIDYVLTVIAEKK